MSLSRSIRVRILERDKYRCAYCGRTSAQVALEVDHVLPRSRGGSDVPTNLITACFDCNNGKGAHDLALPDWVKPVGIQSSRKATVAWLVPCADCGQYVESTRYEAHYKWRCPVEPELVGVDLRTVALA
jgi:5-methylcytosine-specific restriction endonuclease McrA